MATDRGEASVERFAQTLGVDAASGTLRRLAYRMAGTCWPLPLDAHGVVEL